MLSLYHLPSLHHFTLLRMYSRKLLKYLRECDARLESGKVADDIYVEGDDDPCGNEQYDNQGDDGDKLDVLFK